MLLQSQVGFEVICYWATMGSELTDNFAMLPHQIILQTRITNAMHALQEKSQGIEKYIPRGLDLVGVEGRVLTQKGLTLDLNCLIQVATISSFVV